MKAAQSTQQSRKAFIRKIAAGCLSLSLLVATVTPSTVVYADVISASSPEKAMLELQDVFEDIHDGDEMSSDEYRSYFHDVLDTTDVFIAQAEKDRDILKKVTDSLMASTNALTKDLSTYMDVLQEFGQSKKLYDNVMNTLKSTVTPMIDSDGNTVYETNYESGNTNNLRLVISPNGYSNLYEIVGEETFIRAIGDGLNYMIYYVKPSESGPIMICKTNDGLYKGTLDGQLNYSGKGAFYEPDGSVRTGKWSGGSLEGLAYLYDASMKASNTAQFKDGKRHGMTVYKADDNANTYTRIYEDGMLQGASYTQFSYEDSTSDLITYYDEDETLPISVYFNPDGGYTKVLLGTDDDKMSIFISEQLNKTFIGDFNENSFTGFGYLLTEDIEYIGSFENFKVLGHGTYYQLEDTENVFEEKVNQIIDDNIDEDMTDRQKIIKIHDYLVSHILYHHPGAAVTAHPGSSHTAYGAIMYKTAVCDGYAQAFKAFLDKFGIENRIIFGIGANAKGEFPEENAHAWNIVKIGDEYLHFDLTWDDPTYSSKISHEYFFMTTDEIRADHWWIEKDYAQYLD